MSGPGPATPAGVQERELAAAFAARVEVLRHQRGLTKEALAMAAGLTMSSLYRIDSAPRKIHLGLIQRLCRALDVTHDELLRDLPQITERWTRTRRVASPGAWAGSGAFGDRGRRDGK